MRIKLSQAMCVKDSKQLQRKPATTTFGNSVVATKLCGTSTGRVIIEDNNSIKKRKDDNSQNKIFNSSKLTKKYLCSKFDSSLIMLWFSRLIACRLYPLVNWLNQPAMTSLHRQSVQWLPTRPRWLASPLPTFSWRPSKVKMGTLSEEM